VANPEAAGSVSLRGTSVRYWRVENGSADTVLFLHGLGGDHRGLADVAAALPGVDIVIPDLPGYGTSGPMSDEHSLANYADAVADLRSALGLGTCHLLGHSLGASIALVHAAAHGAGLRSLTLLNPVSTATNMTASLGKLYYRTAAALPPVLARFWLASRPAVYLSDAFIIKTKDRARRAWILRQDYENYASASVPAMIESFLSYYRTPFDELAASIAVPTLLTTGTRDGIAPVRAVTALAGHVPNATLVVTPGDGHLAPMENPAATAATVGGFIADLQSTVD
jgi:pimeloyl-ACP methyl ester carboxylesterase